MIITSVIVTVAMVPAVASSKPPEVRRIAIDRGFGDGGTLITRRVEDTVSDPVAIDPAGGFGIVGGARKRTHFERFNRKGKPVRSYGADGIIDVGSADKYQPRVTAAFDRHGRALIILDSQKGQRNALKILRLTRGGRPDRTFGRRGVIWITPPGDADASFAELVFDRSGAISLIESGRLWRLRPSGKPDSRIGPGGLFRPIACGSENRPMSVTFVSPAAPDGSLYIEKSCMTADQSIRVDSEGNESPSQPAAPLRLSLRTARDARGGFLGVSSGDGPERDCESSQIVRIGADGLLDPGFGVGGVVTQRTAGIRVSSWADSPVFDLTLLRDGAVWVYCAEEVPHWPRFRVSASKLSPSGAIESFARPTRLTLHGVQIEEAFADPRGPGSMLVWGYKKKGISLTQLRVGE